MFITCSIWVREDLRLAASSCEMVVYIPEHMTRFVKHHLHGGPPESIDAEALRREVEELRQKNKELQEQVSQLQSAVRHVIVIYLTLTTIYPCNYYPMFPGTRRALVTCSTEKLGKGC